MGFRITWLTIIGSTLAMAQTSSNHGAFLGSSANVGAHEEEVRLDSLPPDLRKQPLFCVASDISIQFNSLPVSALTPAMSLSFEYKDVRNEDGSVERKSVVNSTQSRFSTPICVMKFVRKPGTGKHYYDDPTLLKKLQAGAQRSASILFPKMDNYSGNIMTRIEFNTAAQPSDLVDRIDCYKGTGLDGDGYKDLSVEEILKVFGDHAQISIKRRSLAPGALTPAMSKKCRST